ncbi:MAG: tRNA preQ1(34) S-adenosylmethionine ribosyltransferase-isomerase QueA [Pseudomonadales bacterium]|nr:tRNA preQ1(34) S-adenosylmethionine ribosyltransferase-isomerase QueA [Pseudomonadales bacterium]
MKTEDFDFHLPEKLVAHYPTKSRTASKMLKVDRFGALSYHGFLAFPDFLRSEDIIVFNNTKVIPARVFGEKETGGKVEILLERQLGGNRVLVHLKASRPPKAGCSLVLGSSRCKVVVEGRQDNFFILSFPQEINIEDFFADDGHIPLPPYISREDERVDRERYQTVYADHPGAVAAPTAGLHFDENMLAELQKRGVEMAFVTLHVGAGTFQPVKADFIEDHVMHAERYSLPEETREKVLQARSRGGRVVAIGTTTVRCLESAAQSGELLSGAGETDIFITPGYKFKMVDCLLTNFHLPKSTLLMLVSAFAGKDVVMSAYHAAIERQYRFYSYGDCMFIEGRVCG